MQVYKIKRDAFREIRKQTLWKSLPVLLIALAAGFALAAYNSKVSPSEVNTLPYIVPLVVIVLGVAIYRALAQQLKLLESYAITITGDEIKREQLNTPSITIPLQEVIEISKQADGSFIIQGKNPVDRIAVPVHIENYKELEERLQTIQPVVAVNRHSFFQQYRTLSGLVTIALMVSVYLANNKWIVFIAGALLVSLMSWSLRETQRSKEIDNRTRKSMWWSVLVIISVMLMVIFKLTGVTKV